MQNNMPLAPMPPGSNAYPGGCLMPGVHSGGPLESSASSSSCPPCVRGGHLLSPGDASCSPSMRNMAASHDAMPQGLQPPGPPPQPSPPFGAAGYVPYQIRQFEQGSVYSGGGNPQVVGCDPNALVIAKACYSF